MTFMPTDEQRELGKSFRRLMRDRVTIEYVRDRITKQTSRDPELWRAFVELGLFEYFGSTDEDFQPGLADLGSIAVEAGRALCSEPLLDSLLALYLLRSNSDAQELVQQLSAGGTAAIAFNTGSSDVKVKAGAVTGKSRFVRGVGEATRVLLGASNSKHSMLISPAETGVEVIREQGIDGSIVLSSLQYADAPVEVLKDLPSSTVEHSGRVLRALELAGVMQHVTDLSVEYVKTRKQFSVPVGGFQAVQHQLADMHLNCESSLSLSHFALWAQENSPEQAELSATAAIVYACERATETVERAIQVHGGIGFTWEYELHLYLRRARSLAASFGGTEEDYIDFIELASKA